MSGRSLRDVLLRLWGLELLRDPLPAEPGPRLHGVRTDSRRVQSGDLFCAVRGTVGDGHLHLGTAARSGAVAALVEQPVRDVHLPQWRVTDARRAAAFAAAVVWADPWEEMRVVGVTGTNGKTTSVAILRHLFAQRGPAASIGTLGAVGPDGRTLPGSEGLTTPGPAELAEWFRRLRREGASAVAMEVSSHALHQERVAAVRFDAAVFTNLTRDHLDYHGTVEEYRAAKLRLAGLLKPDGALALNADDPAWEGVRAPGHRLVRFGSAADAEVRAERVRAGPPGMEWVLALPQGRFPVRLPLWGAYNVDNALGAAAALWGLGWQGEEIAAGLATLPQVPGRLERLPTPPGKAAVVADYAHTPDALARALAALRPLAPGRLIVVFGAGGDRDRGKRPEMGRAAQAGADVVIVTSDNPRTEDPERIADDIEGGMDGAPHLRIVDRREAIRCALAEAGEGDVILLAGKGHETYQIRGTEAYPFDERDIVRELLSEPEVNG